MRKIFRGILFVASISLAGLLCPRAVSAEAVTQVVVSGIVSDQGQHAIGYKIVLRCKSSPKTPEEYVDSTSTAGHGWFGIYTDTSKCPLGSIGHLLHERSDGKYDTSWSVVIKPYTAAGVKIGTITYPIPEFGWLGAGVAFAVGGGFVVTHRRRALSA